MERTGVRLSTDHRAGRWQVIIDGALSLRSHTSVGARVACTTSLHDVELLRR
jgi:hypothetical protein